MKVKSLGGATSVCFTAAVAFASAPVSAYAILSTDFDSRTVSGTTASDIIWSTTGLSDPGDLVVGSNDVVDPGDLGLFNGNATSPSAGKLAVNRNLANEGDWFTEVAFTVGENAIFLNFLAFDSYIFNNGGGFQTTSRNKTLSYNLSVLDAASVEVGGGSATDILQGVSYSTGDSVGVNFSLASVVLEKNADYTLRLTASGLSNDWGFNAGIDNLRLDGVVPAPAPMLLLGAGLLGLGASRRAARSQAPLRALK